NRSIFERTESPMNLRFSNARRTAAQTGLAVLAAIALVSGAAWRATADSHQQNNKSEVATVAQTPTLTHAIAGGRDSYADVGKVGAPAVVTVHANGKARVSPTEFQLPDDDLLRRFFGDQSDRGQRGGRRPSYRQSALGSGVIIS